MSEELPVKQNRGGVRPGAGGRDETEIREVIRQMDESQIWDSIQAKDLDQRIIEFVTSKIEEGWNGTQICKAMGIRGGKLSRQWKKIMAHLRQGYRADSDAYLINQTKKIMHAVEKSRVILENALENGVEEMAKDGGIVIVRGASKTLATYMKSHTELISLLPRLWKEYGAIGDKNGPQTGGTTIIVKSAVPTRTREEVDAHRKRFIEQKEASIPAEFSEVKKDKE